jgi:hypothetical protein
MRSATPSTSNQYGATATAQLQGGLGGSGDSTGRTGGNGGQFSFFAVAEAVGSGTNGAAGGNGGGIASDSLLHSVALARSAGTAHATTTVTRGNCGIGGAGGSASLTDGVSASSATGEIALTQTAQGAVAATAISAPPARVVTLYPAPQRRRSAAACSAPMPILRLARTASPA